MRVLHVIPNLGPGGPARSLAVLVAESRRLRPDIGHDVLPLSGPVYMPLRLRLKRMGSVVLTPADAEAAAKAVADADIVLVHFWNTPVLWDWIASGPPPARYVLWSKVEGSYAPQRLAHALVADAAACVFTAPPPGDLGRDGPVVPGLVEIDRVRDVVPQPHEGFFADYLGTLTSGKLHPRFFAMMDRVDVPDLRVRLCGGALDPSFTQALEAVDNRARFEQLGFVEDIAGILRTTDVFAYPLAPTTYGSSDKSLQEAMLAGVPPVVLAGPAPSRFVEDGATGLVAPDEHRFVAAIERLYREPDLRTRLGRAAQAFAREAFDPGPHAARMLETLEAARSAAKRPLSGGLREADRTHGSRHAIGFLVSQGLAPGAALSMVDGALSGNPDPAIAFAAEAPDDLFRLEGGILHWRNAHPEDPVLRLWAAIWLDRQGDPRAAEAEYAAADPVTADRIRAGIEARGLSPAPPRR